MGPDGAKDDTYGPWRPAGLDTDWAGPNYFCRRCGAAFSALRSSPKAFEYNASEFEGLAKMQALRHVAYCGKPDPRLRRVTAHGYTTAYETRDGRFRVENGLAGMDGGARTPWTIRPLTPDAQAWLHAAGNPPDGRLRDARDWLRLSVYDYAAREVTIHRDDSVTVDGEWFGTGRLNPDEEASRV